MMLQVAIFMYKATAFNEFQMDDTIPIRKSTQSHPILKACYTYREPYVPRKVQLSLRHTRRPAPHL